MSNQQTNPFNPIKFELAVILCCGVLLILASDIITMTHIWQLLLLSSYSLLTTIWLIMRTLRVRQHYGKIEKQ